MTVRDWRDFCPKINPHTEQEVGYAKMVIPILTAVLLVSMVVSVWLGAFTLLRCESKKKNAFIALQAAAFMFVLGYVLEINANSVDGGLIAVRVMYIGSVFAPLAYLFFTAGYCEIKISRILSAFLFLVPSAIVSLVWTTPNFHDLIYTKIWYETSAAVHKLGFESGPLYFLTFVFSGGCCLGVVGIITYRLWTWDRKHRANLILILMSAVIPIIANLMYMWGFTPYNIYLTPITMVILNILFYISIVRYDSFGIISRASEMALQSVKEAYILFDDLDNYITSNTTARKLFPSLGTIAKGGHLTEIQDWPSALSFHENREIASPAKFEMPGDNYYTASISPIVADNKNLLGHVVLIQDVTESTMLTKNLQRTLEEVSALKVQQDGDYFLTSLLINPLLVKEVQSDAVSVEFYTSQKKKFSFRNRDREIGGDLCIAREITLMDRRYLAFTNADAMGKSLQGAGGALVMGVIFHSYVNRTPLFSSMYMRPPESWISEIYRELQRVYVSFDGSMLISATIGLIDEETGAMYYLNAEHPWMVCYRGGKASFTENELTMHKIGTVDSDAGIVIQALQLYDGDVIFLGSDGRDDVLIGMDDATGNRVINEDETRFLRCVEDAKGELKGLVENITRESELTDDFTIIRVEWKKPAPVVPSDFEAIRASAYKACAQGSPGSQGSDLTQAIQLLRKAMYLYPDPELIEKLAACHRERGESQEIIQTYQYGLNAMPLNEALLYNMVNECRRMVRDLLEGAKKGKEDTKKISSYIQMALDYGERLLIVNPQHYKGMLHVADCYRMLRRFADARALLGRARQISPDDDNLKTIERMLDRDEAQYAEKATL